MFCLDEQSHIKDHLMYLQQYVAALSKQVPNYGITAT
jgi:hypothetical protein